MWPSIPSPKVIPPQLQSQISTDWDLASHLTFSEFQCPYPESGISNVSSITNTQENHLSVDTIMVLTLRYKMALEFRHLLKNRYLRNMDLRCQTLPILITQILLSWTSAPMLASTQTLKETKSHQDKEGWVASRYKVQGMQKEYILHWIWENSFQERKLN